MKTTPLTRRKFLVASGVALAAVPAALQRNEARAANTTAPFKIDCQSHLFCPELLSLLEKRKGSPYAYRKGADLYVAIGKGDGTFTVSSQSGSRRRSSLFA